MNSILRIAIQGIDASFHEPYASLMKGLIYGLPLSIDPLLKNEIIKSGLAHLVVLSEANVTLLVQFSEKICFSFSKRVGIVLQIIFLGLFIYMVGPQAPLIRAVCMFICTVVCILAGRPSSIVWNLFLTILLVALGKPKWITSISFQLSIVATIGIILWGALSSHLNNKLNPLVEVFLESWMVFLVTTPLSIYYFKSISLISPLSTALVSWLIVPLMVAGLGISIIYLLFPPIASIFAIPTQFGLHYIIFIIQTTSRFPFGYITLQ